MSKHATHDEVMAELTRSLDELKAAMNTLGSAMNKNKSKGSNTTKNEP